MIELVFLGTGSAIPTANRNHSAFLLKYKSENILIDCGEGTQRQFRKAKLNPCSVTKILVTHWHGDHVLGLPGLLKTLSLSNYSKKLEIYGPKGSRKYMYEISRLFGLDMSFVVVHEVHPGKFFDNGDFEINAEMMEHGTPCNAYSFVLKDKLRIDKKRLQKLKIKSGPHMSDIQKGKDITLDGKKYRAKDVTYLQKGKKISFVMDTRVNNRIGRFVKNSNVMVIESSFSEELKEKAEEYNHMTATQAAKIAKKYSVDKLYLTHVSERYAKDLNDIVKEAKKNFKNSMLAEDLMRIEV
jgi:ribonuclease Z